MKKKQHRKTSKNNTHFEKQKSFRALLFFVVLFLCMLLFESQRFSLYFEHKSTEVPELAPELLSINNTLQTIATYSGIEASMELIGTTFNELASDAPLNTDAPLAAQYQEYVQKQINYLIQLPHSLGFTRLRNEQIIALQEKKSLNTSQTNIEKQMSENFSTRFMALFIQNLKATSHSIKEEYSSFANALIALPNKLFSAQIESTIDKSTSDTTEQKQSLITQTKETHEETSIVTDDASDSSSAMVTSEVSKEATIETSNLIGNVIGNVLDGTTADKTKEKIEENTEEKIDIATNTTHKTSDTSENLKTSLDIPQEAPLKEAIETTIADSTISEPNTKNPQIEPTNFHHTLGTIASARLTEKNNPAQEPIEIQRTQADFQEHTLTNIQETPQVELQASDLKNVLENALDHAQDAKDAKDAKNAKEQDAPLTASKEGMTQRDDSTLAKQEQATQHSPHSSRPIYEPSHSHPAPTKEALPEYHTRMPDFGKKMSVLLIGDSMMMEGLGPSLQAMLRKRTDLEVNRLGRYSSGLTRPDFYNWPESLARLEEKHTPDLIIISLGANDTQDIVEEKKRYFIDTKDWEEKYRERTFAFLKSATLSSELPDLTTLKEYTHEIAEHTTVSNTLSNNTATEVSTDALNTEYTEKQILSYNAQKAPALEKALPTKLESPKTRSVIWVSLPIMFFEKYAQRTKIISKVQEEVNACFTNSTFINIEHLLTDEKGQYTSFTKDKNNKTVRLRREDNIHVTELGGNILALYTLPYVDRALENLRMAHFEENQTILPPVAGQANHVLFTSIARGKETEYYIYLPEPPTNAYSNISRASVNTEINTEEQKRAHHTDELNATRSQHSPTTQELIAQNMAFTEERFPVLYLLHGAYTESANVWNEYMGKELQAIANEKRVIIVAPFAESFAWYLDAPQEIQIVNNASGATPSTKTIPNPNRNSQIETYFIKELLPHIDALYPTNKKRALAGISMGGHGALLFGLKHPQLFSSLASLSGALDIRLHPNQWKIKNLLGDMALNQEYWDSNSALTYITKQSQKSVPKHILITTSSDDSYVLEDNQKALSLLTEQQFSFEYMEDSGDHSWDFWKKHLPSMLRKQAEYIHAL